MQCDSCTGWGESTNEENGASSLNLAGLVVASLIMHILFMKF